MCTIKKEILPYLVSSKNTIQSIKDQFQGKELITQINILEELNNRMISIIQRNELTDIKVIYYSLISSYGIEQMTKLPHVLFCGHVKNVPKELVYFIDKNHSDYCTIFNMKNISGCNISKL